MSNNLEFWNKVKKTDPKYTKKVTQRGGYTAISPQYQAMVATEQWGMYGASWGLKNIKHDYSLFEVTRMAILHAVFFYPGGEFEITNAIEVVSAKGYPDADFAKKLETNTISKALSKLGFSADVFMGEFDDIEYVEQRMQESAIEHAENKEEEAEKQKQIYLDEMKDLIRLIEESNVMSMANGLYKKAIRKAELRSHKQMIIRVQKAYDEVKERLETKQ